MSQTQTGFARAVFASSVVCLCLALAPIVSHAQAWLPEKGSMSLSLDYTSSLNKKHFTSTGAEIDAGHTDMEALSISASYGLSDRFMIRAGLPYVTTRYRGSAPHPVEVDDGDEHSSVTDLQLSLHYQLMDGPFALAPYAALVIPTNSYPRLGHASPGRRLNEYWIGFYAGRSLNDWIPRTYVQGRYNYAFVEGTAGIGHDRSNADLEIGYFLNPSWSVRVLGAWQETHGGVDVPVPLSSPLFQFHDILADESFLNIGGGTSWTINDRWSAYGLYMHALDGKNGHKVEHRVWVGFSYGLASPLSVKRQAVIATGDSRVPPPESR